MKRIRYSQWDGTRTWRDLEGEDLADRLFEELSHYMNWSLTAQEALEWMARQGVNIPDLNLHVLGTDELLKSLRQERQEAFQAYHLRNALDEIKDKIQDIVERELKTARTDLGAIHPEFIRREEHLRSLPVRPGEALAELSAYDASPGFLDAEAKRMFDELMAEQENLTELEQFILRYGRQFQGPKALDYQEALKAMAEFKQMANLSDALRSGNFKTVSLKEMEALLGDEAAQSILILMRFKDELEEAGYIQPTEEGFRLTPKGFRKIGQSALQEIFKDLKQDHFGLHNQSGKGSSAVIPEETVPYEYGRPFNVNIVKSLSNAIRNGGINSGFVNSGGMAPLGPSNMAPKRPGITAPKGPSIRLTPEDFEVHEEAHDTQATTVLMLDMSWSMSRDGRFPAAKRVALALDHLIRTSYPRDHYYTVGFSTRARELTPDQLTEATWDPSDPFTNLQEGLFLARQIFRRHRAVNRQVIVITDGQPTATHINGHTNAQWPGFMGSIPPDIHADTLKEVDNCSREKVVLNIFMLDDNPVLTGFIEEVVRINRGRAFYSLPDNLGKYLLVDYLARRRKQVG